MCDAMTSHLYHITNGPAIHTSSSHSQTREALKIGDQDERYAEVEWADGKELEIRFPGSWGDQQREDCRNFYARHAPTMIDLQRWVITRAAVVKIAEGHEHTLDGVGSLPACEWLDCYCCTGLAALPALPACEWLDCYGCTGLAALPELPAC